MKKIGIISLLFLYLIPAIGVTVSAHSCRGKITSVSFNTYDTKHKCPCGSKKMPKDCCKDKTAIIKLDDEQQKTQQIFSSIIKVADYQPDILNKQVTVCLSPLHSRIFELSAHPPDDRKIHLYLKNRVFRI